MGRTPEEERTVLEMYANGVYWTDIISTTGLKCNMITRILNKHGVRKRQQRLPLEIREQAALMIYEKIPYKVIAQQLGYDSPGTVASIARSLEVPKRRRKYDAELFQQVAILHAQGLNDKEIGKKLQLMSQRICDIRNKRLKLPRIERSRERAVAACAKATKTGGSMGVRRWKEEKYDVWLDGAPFGLTKMQWDVLKYLQDNPDSTCRQIAAAIEVNASDWIRCVRSVRRHIKDLKRLGLVKRGLGREPVYISTLAKKDWDE